jgi:hypothetical protein
MLVTQLTRRAALLVLAVAVVELLRTALAEVSRRTRNEAVHADYGAAYGS